MAAIARKAYHIFLTTFLNLTGYFQFKLNFLTERSRRLRKVMIAQAASILFVLAKTVYAVSSNHIVISVN